jgi:hypothetical protein
MPRKSLRKVLTDTYNQLTTVQAGPLELPRDPQGRSEYPPGWVLERSGQLWVMGVPISPDPKQGLDLVWLAELFEDTMDYHGKLLDFEPECEMGALHIEKAGPLLYDKELRAHMRTIASREDGKVVELIVVIKLGNTPVEMHFMREMPIQGQCYAFRIRQENRIRRCLVCPP